jgi:hypothetical protein
MGPSPNIYALPIFLISGTIKKAAGYFYKYALEHTPKTLRNKHRLKNIIKILLQKLRYTPDEKNIGQRKIWKKIAPRKKQFCCCALASGFL